MSIKIQINSLAALERLIGGDSDIEIQVRNNIVQEFTKRYLKDLVATEELKRFKNEIINSVREEIKANIHEEIKVPGYTYPRSVIKPEVKKELINSVRADIMSEICDEIKTNLGVDKAKEIIESETQNVLNNLLRKLSKESLEATINLRVKTKLREILDN